MDDTYKEVLDSMRETHSHEVLSTYLQNTEKREHQIVQAGLPEDLIEVFKLCLLDSYLKGYIAAKTELPGC